MPRMEADGQPVVALVASAGGLEALTRVLGPLPENFPAPIIVLQHLDPSWHSELSAILGRRCRLTVKEAGYGDRLSPGTVYVAPRGRHLLHTADACLVLIESGRFPPHRPSADLLLLSLALTVGARTIAAVLSGVGMDGATGASAVQTLGGTVIAATPESSRQRGMPEAAIARTGVVDYQVHVDDIAAKLIELVNGEELEGTEHLA